MEDFLTPDGGSQAMFDGALAGLVATAPMTAVMLLLHRLLPAWEQYPLEPRRITTRLARRAGLDEVAEEEPAATAATAVAHFGYGAAAGALFPPLAGWLPVNKVAAGLAYGLAVWAGSYLGLVPALGLLSPATEQPRRRNLLMITAHLVWGGALGLLLARRRAA